MAKILNQYYFLRPVHKSINCLLDPLVIGMDSMAVGSQQGYLACSAKPNGAGPAQDPATQQRKHKKTIAAWDMLADSELAPGDTAAVDGGLLVSGSLSGADSNTIGNSVIIDKHACYWEPVPSISKDCEVVPRVPLIPVAGSNFSSGASHQLQSNYLIDLQTASMYSEFENIANEDESDEDESAFSHMT